MNPAKIDKMDEEIGKWRKKDLLAIKRSMSHPGAYIDNFIRLRQRQTASNVMIRFHDTKWRFYTLHVCVQRMGWNPFSACAFASPLTQYKTLMQTLTQTHTQMLRVNTALVSAIFVTTLLKLDMGLSYKRVYYEQPVVKSEQYFFLRKEYF